MLFCFIFSSSGKKNVSPDQKTYKFSFQQLDLGVKGQINLCLLSIFNGNRVKKLKKIEQHTQNQEWWHGLGCLDFTLFKNYISVYKAEGRIQDKQEIQLEFEIWSISWN